MDCTGEASQIVLLELGGRPGAVKLSVSFYKYKRIPIADRYTNLESSWSIKILAREGVSVLKEINEASRWSNNVDCGDRGRENFYSQSWERIIWAMVDCFIKV